jgi:hypothetical protein
MAALHNTLSAAGFVMEMTTEDDKGGKTLMTTVALKKAENYSLDNIYAPLKSLESAYNCYIPS